MTTNPADILYSKSHEWVRIESDEAVVGITHFAQESLGDITYVELPAVGGELAEHAEFGSVESVKAASDLYSPVAGSVLAVNGALEDTPELCNSDPYGEGWRQTGPQARGADGCGGVRGFLRHCLTKGRTGCYQSQQPWAVRTGCGLAAPQND